MKERYKLTARPIWRAASFPAPDRHASRNTAETPDNLGSNLGAFCTVKARLKIQAGHVPNAACRRAWATRQSPN